VYERAGGGPGTSNPVGVQGTPNSYGRVPVPNLQPVNARVSTPSDFVAPVGFGPIAPGWPSRRERLGRSAILAGGAGPDVRHKPLPDDLQPAYFNHAPRDQQVQLLRDRERIVMEHMNPDHPRFVTSLPSVLSLACGAGARAEGLARDFAALLARHPNARLRTVRWLASAEPFTDPPDRFFEKMHEG